jgi:N-methylhydantoinase A/oxoprolinase/acetone carboxylase beta subunit
VTTPLARTGTDRVAADEATFVIYVDTGGTFSDAAIVAADGVFTSGKAPTTPDDLEQCFFRCIEDGAEKLGLSLEQLFDRTTLIGFGTTAGTNALITGANRPRLGLITTAGFEDTLNIMRMEGKVAGYPVQKSLHLAGTRKPEELVPRTLVFGVEERIDSRGRVVLALNDQQVRDAGRALIDAGVDGIAVGLLWSFLNDEHERRIVEILRQLDPSMPVAASAEVAPVMREYPRFASTVVDLLIGPPVRKLLSTVHERLAASGYQRRLLVMQASGGLARADIVRPIKTLHSGPVGGLTGVEFLRDLYDVEAAVGTDMGGTSFDISLARKGRMEYERTPVVARYHLANPMLGIEAIGAGGGTIARVDPLTGRLRLGPESAGSVPGPVCYGRGGTQPTVTDANVVLNRIDSGFFLDGKMQLDRDSAASAIEELIAHPLGIPLEDAALGIVDGIEGIMRSGIQAFLNRKGLDPQKVMLVSFGGAGPTHAAGYTDGMNFDRVVIPPQAATFSAFGASTADIQHRYESSAFVVLANLPYEVTTQRFTVSSAESIPTSAVERYNASFEALERQAYEDMAAEGFERDAVRLNYILDVRYGGQLRETSFKTSAQRLTGPGDLAKILSQFEDEYIRLYTQNTLSPRGGIEIITMTVEALAGTGHVPNLTAVAGRTDTRRPTSRQVYTKDGWGDAIVHDFGSISPETRIEGLAIIEGNDTTVVVPAGHEVAIDRYGNLLLTRLQPARQSGKRQGGARVAVD